MSAGSTRVEVALDAEAGPEVERCSTLPGVQSPAKSVSVGPTRTTVVADAACPRSPCRRSGRPSRSRPCSRCSRSSRAGARGRCRRRRTRRRRGRASSIARRTRRVHSSGPSRLVSTSRVELLGVERPRAGPGTAIPALFTSASTGPSTVLDRGEERVDRRAGRSRRATWERLAAGLDRDELGGRRRASSSRRAPSATCQPSAPSATAIARPMPRRRAGDGGDASARSS